MGRLGIEVYPQGDSAEIGYANLMIRQPIIIVPRTFDGLDAEITRTTSNGTIRLKGLAGWAKGHVIGSTEPYDMSGSKLMGAIAEYSQNGWTGRAAIADIHVQDDPAELLPGSAFSTNINATPNGAEILKVLSMKDRTIKFSSLSLAYDEGKVQGIASYNMLESSNWSNQHFIYANMGYRIGKVTPFISWSMQHNDRNLIATGLPNLPQTAAFNQIALFVQAAQPIMINQTDITVGARYDFAENMALKFQVDHFRYKDPNSIINDRLLTEPVENRSTKSLTLLSLALDFVF